VPPDFTRCPPRSEEVAPNIYAYVQPDGGWFVNNSGILVGADTVALIDTTATAARTQLLREAVRALSPLPISTLVNTHWHSDHTNGNYQFGAATIVAHDSTREAMLLNPPMARDPDGLFPDVDWGPLEPAPPFLTYGDGVTLWVGGVRCDVTWVGRPAHTTGDSVVWIEEHSILFAGDLAFNGGTPLMSAGSISGSMSTLNELADLHPRVVVPGHGDVCGPDVFAVEIEYLRFVQDVAAFGHRAGRTPLEAAIDVSDHPFRHLRESERLAANLHRAYAEIDGAEPGASIDLAATRRDMMILNEGRPLRCLA